MGILFSAIFGALIIIGTTYFLSRVFRKKMIKYIPSLLLIGISSYLIIKGRFFATGGFDSLIMGIWAVILFYGAIIGIISSVVIDFLKRKKNNS